MSELATQVATRAAALRDNKPKSVDEFLEQYRGEFARALPEWIDPQRFMRLALNQLRYQPALREVEAQSLIGAMMTSAALGLEPLAELGHIYFVPFNVNVAGKGRPQQWVKRVQVIIGYAGMIELATRTGKVRTVKANPVYENDHFTYRIVNGQDEVDHGPIVFGERGKLIGAYATAVFADGSSMSKVISIDEAEAARKRSKSSKSEKDGPWETDYEAMVLKTAVRRLWKWLPKSSEGSAAFSVDARVVREIPTLGVGGLSEDPLMLDAVSGEPEEHVVLDAEETMSPAEEVS